MSFEDVESRELRQALAAVAETATPREDCPEPESLWDAVQGELSPNTVKEVVDHTATCAACAESWRLAVELMNGEAGVTDLTDDTGDTRFVPGDGEAEVVDDGFWRSWVQVAALVAVLAGAGLVVHHTDWLPGAAGPDAPVRSGEETGITALTPQNRALSREDLTLRWTAPAPDPAGPATGDGELRYDVEVTWVTEASSTVVFRARDLERAELKLPREALAELPPDAVILWSVTAWRDGELADRETFNFRLR